MRVQIPAYHDMWMKGDRYGNVVRQDTLMVDGVAKDRVSVLLDNSNKIVRVLLDDCTVVDQ